MTPTHRPIRILELRSVRGTGGGPDKTILLGAARTNREHFAITVCYIRDERDPVFFIDQRATGLPIDYVELRERHSFDRRVWPAVRRLAHERAIDIVHAHDYKTDFLAYLLWKRDGIMPLSTAHGWSGHSRREAGYYWVDKRLLARFPRVIAVSSEIQHELVRHGSRSVVLVPNAIDHREFRRDRGREHAVRASLGLSSQETVVGTIGRLEREKRYDLLIDAVALLRQRQLPVTLLIAGEGSLRTDLMALANRRQLGTSCRLLGHVSDIVEFHHALNVCVQSSSNEGTSNAILEAMALETPIVATHVGGTTDLLQNDVHAVLVAPGDAQLLATAISRVLGDPRGAAQRVSAARRRVETELSFDTRMSKVEQVCEDLFRSRFRAPVAAEAMA